MTQENITSSGYYTLFVGRDNQYYFNLKAGNNEIILQSEGYESKQGALNGIESVREHCTDESNFKLLESKDDQFYFVLHARNGEPIGHSETYKSVAMAKHGIKSVMKNGKTEKIKFLEDEPKVKTIVVNAKKHEWPEKEISFKEVVILAFGTFNDNGRTSYTVTYSRGHSSKVQGSLVYNESVKVKHKMIFNVTATDKS
ncbi:MAG: multiubiquitin domain-containing protein [Vicingaceae bacterium]